MAHLHSAELTKYENWLFSFSMAPAMPPPAAWTDPNIPRLAEITNTKLEMKNVFTGVSRREINVYCPFIFAHKS